MSAGLDSFVGQEFDLTAVGTNILDGNQSGAANICFTLDGHTYMAEENPEDGYRSSLDSVRTVAFVLPNAFPACRVRCEWPPVDADWKENTGLILFRSASTNKVILEVGTDYSDEYYPSFIASFRPENMDINGSEHDARMNAVLAGKPEGWATW